MSLFDAILTNIYKWFPIGEIYNKMENEFLDKSIFEQDIDLDFPILKNFKKLKYNLKTGEKNTYTFFIEINDERLNSTEIKALLKLNEKKSFFSDTDKLLLNYISHRLSGTITIYKILTDIGLVLTYLKGSSFPTFLDGNKIKFGNEDFKLDIDLSFDKDSNISMIIKTNGDFIFSTDKIFFLKDNIIYDLSEKVPHKFYKEIATGHNKFSIDSFLEIKDIFLEKLKTIHNIKIDSEIKKLVNLKIEEKIATAVLEVGKTSHFIIMKLRYKIGNEFFDIENYKYAENEAWVDKTNMIKIVKENNKLVKYVSDISISEDIYREIFGSARIRYNTSSKSPFLIMLPIANLEIFVNDVIPNAENFFEVVYKDGIKLKVVDGLVHFDIETNLKSRLDLFEFNVNFKIGGENFDLDYLKELMQKSRKYVQLKNGTTINIENIREINKWIEFLNKYEFKKTDNLYNADSKTALELDEFLKGFEDKSVKSNEEYKDLIQELKERKPLEEVSIPKCIDPILRDYQKEGVYWFHFLAKYGFNGILADEMGLGKTVQTLTILEKTKSDGPSLVICPKSLIYNWENEVKKYFPQMKILIIDGDHEKRRHLVKNVEDADIVITSYSMLQKDYMEYMESKVVFKYLVLDEAHYVKNMKTLSAKAVRLIKSRHKILLTGTPLENNLDELYGTFDLIMPGYLGSKLDFSREFVSKIERNNRIALELLQSKIKPFILRRTKADVLKELPPKQEQTVYNEMTNKQVGIYNEVLNRVKLEVNSLIEKKSLGQSRIQVLSALLKLRQVCNHPQLLDDSFIGEHEISGKYNQFLELLNEVIEADNKVLVFSQFTSMLSIFEKDLERLGIKFLRLDGSTKNRQELVDEFNNDDSIKVFLISLKAGGVGLNLTSASAVFLYDPWWNPMVEKQAMDRAHRIGQTKTVHVYKFITKNSIEEKILKLQERKGNLFDNLVKEDQGFMKKLEWDDLMELFD